jgi:hypothetical protein
MNIPDIKQFIHMMSIFAQQLHSIFISRRCSIRLSAGH